MSLLLGKDIAEITAGGTNYDSSGEYTGRAADINVHCNTSSAFAANGLTGEFIKSSYYDVNVDQGTGLDVPAPEVKTDPSFSLS